MDSGEAILPDSKSRLDSIASVDVYAPCYSKRVAIHSQRRVRDGITPSSLELTWHR